MAQSKDLYEMLGVSREASQEEIRKAYLKLAHKYHPDKTGGDKEAEAKLKEVNAAYDVLKNPEKRRHYDQFGSENGSNPFGQGGFGGGFGGAGGGFGGSGFEAPFEDFFDMLFGQGKGRGGRQAGRPGNDLELRVSITLEEAAFGVKKKVRFPRRENCADCKGTGAAAGSQPEVCSQCGGSGQVRVAHGFFSVTRTCPRCNGEGRMNTNPCRSCSGEGHIKTTRELSVDIPAGVDTGSRLRINGEGEPGSHGAPRGDLYVYIEVMRHEIFERDATTILCEAPISLMEAALGASIRVPTLEGSAELKVPAGTQTGALLRLRGLGMPDLRGYQQGDQIVKIVVETPVKLSRKQRELLQELDAQSGHQNYPQRKRFDELARKHHK